MKISKQKKMALGVIGSTIAALLSLYFGACLIGYAYQHTYLVSSTFVVLVGAVLWAMGIVFIFVDFLLITDMISNSKSAED